MIHRARNGDLLLCVSRGYYYETSKGCLYSMSRVNLFFVVAKKTQCAGQVSGADSTTCDSQPGQTAAGSLV
jgi:hypothetical protein